MMSDFLTILGLAGIGSVIALLGGAFFLVSKKWSERLETYSVPFAAGVLLTVSIVGLLPESVHMLGESAYKFVLASFAVAFIFEKVFFQVHHHSHHHTDNYKGAIPLVIFGDSIHNFIDGVAISSTYMISPGLGLITTLSTFLHEVPHEIGDFGILLRAGWRRKKVFIVNLLSASTTFLGAIVSFLFISDEAVLGALMAISSGIFLYLGASDFLPHIGHERGISAKNLAPFLIGILVMLFTINAIPHEHKEGDESNHDEVSWNSSLITSSFD